MEWTLEEFGARAALRCDALIKRALKDISANPELPGWGECPELLVPSARTYHLRFSRNRLSGLRVKCPRHFILYRRRADGGIDVGRIVHDRRDLHNHLSEDFRRTSGFSLGIPPITSQRL